jgi:hypothetical protein
MILYGGFDGITSSNTYGDVWSLQFGDSLRWIPLSPTGSPPLARHDPLAIYDAKRRHIVLFGGSGNYGDYEDSWELTLGGAPAWNPLVPDGPIPDGHTAGDAIYDRDRDRMLVSFGIGTTYHSDTWAFSLVWPYVWTQLLPETPAPVARALAAEALDTRRGRVILFGGQTTMSVLNDTWTLSLSDPRWFRLGPYGNPPSGRVGSAAVFDPQRRRMVAFGGYDLGIGIRNDASGFQTIPDYAWSTTAPTGISPSPRSGHTSIYDPAADRALIFSGYDGAYYNDLWSHSFGGAMSWSSLAVAGVLPPPRQGQAVARDPLRQRMLVIGGSTPFGRTLNDVWSMSMTTAPTWSQVVADGTPPGPRAWASAIYDPVRDRVLVYGGLDLLDQEVWVLSLAGSPTWSQLSVSGVKPPARGRHTAIYDPVRDAMVVYGGTSSEANPLWTLSLSGVPQWSQSTGTGTNPVPRQWQAAVYDARLDRMLMFGGSGGGIGYTDETWELTWGQPIFPAIGSPGWLKAEPNQVVTISYSISHGAESPRAVEWSLHGNRSWPGLPRSGVSLIRPQGDSVTVEFAVPDTAVVGTSTLTFDAQVSGAEGNRTTSGLILDVSAPTPTPVLASPLHVRCTPEGVEVTWQWQTGTHIRIERCEPGTGWLVQTELNVDPAGDASWIDRNARAGARYGYRLELSASGRSETTPTEWIDIPAPPTLSLEALRPNPVNREVDVSFSLPMAGSATIGLIDILGRTVAEHSLTNARAGAQTIRLEWAGSVPAGIYFVRLSQKSLVRMQRVCILR